MTTILHIAIRTTYNKPCILRGIKIVEIRVINYNSYNIID